MPRKPRAGRPPYVPTPQERQWVTVAAAGAMPQRDIAARLGISAGALRKACRKELDTGLATCTVQVAANFLRIATGDSKSAAWAADRWLRMRAPEQWHDPPTEIGNAGGQPFAIAVITGVPRATDESDAG